MVNIFLKSFLLFYVWNSEKFLFVESSIKQNLRQVYYCTSGSSTFCMLILSVTQVQVVVMVIYDNIQFRLVSVWSVTASHTCFKLRSTFSHANICQHCWSCLLLTPSSTLGSHWSLPKMYASVTFICMPAYFDELHVGFLNYEFG